MMYPLRLVGFSRYDYFARYHFGLRRSPVAFQGDSQQRADIRDQRCELQPPKPLVATARAPKSASLRIALRDSAKR